VSEERTRPFFIPPWLDDLKIKPIPFRVLCNLLRRAGEDGRCFPSAETIARDCRINRDTVWPTLQTLIDEGLIQKLKKGFQASNGYVLTLPIGGKTGVIDEEPIGGKTGVINPAQSAEKPGCQSAEKPGCQSAEKRGREEIHSKKSILRKTSPEVSPEGIQFAHWFKSTLPASVNLKSDWQESFAKAHDDLVRLDHRSPEEIRQVCQWARSDPFWQTNFMSPAKLRKRNGDGITYFDLFAEKMKPSHPAKPITAPLNTGTRREHIERIRS
jgi:hypothetical protein